MEPTRDRVDALSASLRPHYRRFLEHLDGEVLMTAHSHQAWPDVSREAQVEAWDAAARWADEKWGPVFEDVLPDFARRVTSRMGSTRAQDLALGPNTHELGYRLLSCFAPTARVLTTDQEFHSLRRQLLRASEDGLRVEWLPVQPDLRARIAASVARDRPDLVALSQVTFTTGARLPDLEAILSDLANAGVPVLVDTYHGFNVVEMDVEAWPGTVFVVGGGYKYAQSGEGACWMLLPRHGQEDFRPRQTGWFADFSHLSDGDSGVRYGDGGQRFFGATFDPTCFYRGRAVLRWMDEVGLTPERLEQAARDRTELIIEAFDGHEMKARGLSLATPRAPGARGGFVTFARRDAADLRDRLRARGIRSDVRGDLLRFGPAPYTSSKEIDQAMQVLAEIL